MDIEKLRWWSYKRQQLGKQGSSAKQVLQDVIGVYSPHPTTVLSLAARVSGFNQDAFYDVEESSTRIPSMRGSVYMVAKTDASNIYNATRPEDKLHWEKRYSQEGRKIPVEHFSDWQIDLLSILQEPKTAKEIKEETIVPADKLKFVLNRMGYEGSLVRVGSENLRSNIIKYLSAKVSLGDNLHNDNGRQKAQIWLAKEYLRAFGPARVKDFKWWAGIKSTEAKDAIEQLDTEVVYGDYLILKEDLEEFSSFKAEPKEVIDILPQWDCYMMGYPADGRARLCREEHLSLVYGKLGATGGNALSAIMVNGLIEGLWKHKISGTKMTIAVNLFEKSKVALKERIQQEFNLIANLLNIKSLSISFE